MLTLDQKDYFINMKSLHSNGSEIITSQIIHADSTRKDLGNSLPNFFN